jgi:hypothetical protein
MLSRGPAGLEDCNEAEAAFTVDRAPRLAVLMCSRYRLLVFVRLS